MPKAHGYCISSLNRHYINNNSYSFIKGCGNFRSLFYIIIAFYMNKSNAIYTIEVMNPDFHERIKYFLIRNYSHCILYT